MVSAYFTQAVATNVAYWRECVHNLTDAQIRRLNQDHPNLLRAAEFGQVLPATQPATAELILHAFSLIERCGHWEAWLSLLERAIAACGEDALPLKVKLLNCRGLLLRLCRQSGPAIAAHEEARMIAERLAAPQTIAEANFNLSEDYRLSRDHVKAEAYGLAALETFTHLNGAEKWLAATLNTLGLVARELGRLDTSAERLRQAVALWRQLNQATELGRSLNNLAITLQAQEEYTAALAQFQEAATVLETTASELDKSKVLLSLGSLYFKLEQFEQAADAFRQADSPALRQSGDSYVRAVVALNLGNALLKQGHLAESERYLRRSLVFWQQAGDDLGLANASGTLGEALLAQGQGAAARRCFNEAIGLLSNYLHNPWAKTLLNQFASEREKSK